MRSSLLAALVLALPVSAIHAKQFVKADTYTPPVVKVARSRMSVKRAEELNRRVPDVIDAKLQNSQSEYLAKYHGVGTTLLTSRDEQTLYMIVHRTTPSRPEVHARWDDMVIVRSGTGAIEMGDSLVGSTYRAPGERVGGMLVKSTRLVVHAGDVVRIPAAVPHIFIASKAEPLDYLLIKQRRQTLPIRWFGDP